MLTLHRVAKQYGDIPVLHPTDLSILPKKTTVLIGPSGCGKSTLIRLIIGLIQPNNGSILFEGKPINDGNIRSLRQRFGYVIQEGGLFPHLTARGNVTLMAQYLGWSRERIETRLMDLTALTRFPKEGLERYPIHLSGGQRQRVALMRALILDPDLLLLDEPLGALDPMIRFDLQNELKAIFRELGKTVVLVTHDIGEAAYLGDMIVLLREGRIVQKGSIEDLMMRPEDPFVERFIRAQRNSVTMREEGR